MKTTILQSSLLALTLVGFAFPAGAVMVNWSSSFYGTHQDSHGEAVTAGFTFELGAFAEGFAPTSDNTGDWAENWITLDSVSYDEGSGNFASAADTKATPLAPGTKTFVWGFDHRDLESSAQWVLLSSSNWNWPGAGVGSENPARVWTVADAGESILGSLHESGAEFRMAKVVGASQMVTPGEWLEANFEDVLDQAEVSGWNADPDRDGLANIMEYAFGSDPNQVGVVPGPVEELVREKGAFRIRIQVPYNSASQTRISMERSDDLQHWEGDSLVTILNNPEAPGFLVFESPIDPNAPHSFRRLRVELDDGTRKPGDDQ